MPLLLACRALAALVLVVVVASYVTAGLYLQSSDPAVETAHGTAAIVLHVVTGLFTIGLGLLAWRTGRGWWTALVGAAVFGYTFVQAALGSYSSMTAHVAGALFVALAPAVLATWLFLARPAVSSSTA